MEAPKYPNVYQAAKGNGTVLSTFGTKFSLPEGTIREDSKDYEEISIPVTTQAAVRTTESPILIGELDKWVQSAFPGYKSLNRIQSIVFPIAFGTNENLLICAPTGAGKTDVAMLTVLKAISHHISENVIDFQSFKIVYVAPMKALAAEITGKFSKRLAYLGIKVRELTGDMQMTKAEISATQMIVTTPEKVPRLLT